MRAALPWIVVALLATSPTGAQGQEPDRRQEPLTLMDAARTSLATHPSVAAARARREAAGASRAEATAAWLPDVTLDASYTHFEEPMLVTPLHAFDLTEIPVFDRDLVQGSLASRWTLLDGGERSGAIGRARALEEASLADLEDAEARLLAAVTSAYLEVLTRRETVLAHEARLYAIGVERERVDLAVREGKAAQVDGARAEAALASARADQVAAAESLAVAGRDLARLLGDDGPAADDLGDRLIEPAPSRPPADTLHLREDAPVLRRARAEIEAAEAARRAAQGRWIPDLQLASGYVERGALGESYTGEWQVGVQLEYLLFAGGARRAAVSRALAERRAAQERLRLVEDETEARIDRAAAALRSARERAEALALAVDSYEDVVRVESVALSVGAGVMSEFLDAQADLLEARAAEVRARHAVLESEVELARATGSLDLEWLERRLGGAP